MHRGRVDRSAYRSKGQNHRHRLAARAYRADRRRGYGDARRVLGTCDPRKHARESGRSVHGRVTASCGTQSYIFRRKFFRLVNVRFCADTVGGVYRIDRQGRAEKDERVRHSNARTHRARRRHRFVLAATLQAVLHGGGIYAGETLYSEATFNFWMYVMAAAVLIVVYVVYVLTAGRKETTPEGEPLTTPRRIKDIAKALPYVAVMAACLFGANYFQTISTSIYGMKAQVLYPVIKAGCLISSNLQGALLFNEKLTVQNVVGSIVALGGMILINVLG